jgi:hypothetical protein
MKERRAAVRGEPAQAALRALRDEAARVMMALDDVGLHEAAAHVSMSLLSIDEAAASTLAPRPKASVH